MGSAWPIGRLLDPGDGLPVRRRPAGRALRPRTACTAAVPAPVQVTGELRALVRAAAWGTIA
ncbi:hypothetical protein ACFWMU_24405 [Streptomyces sp. NPDC058357]|uniref:hypothetical protein n=1 Tax=unclassified Streptomyces TaxID=2593676 RepID=UPI00364C8801